MNRSSLGALLALVMILAVAFAAGAGDIKTDKIAKTAGGGSTGDSVGVAADTVSYGKLPRDISGLWFGAAADSEAVYTLQYSYDNLHWYQLDKDTVSAGTAEQTADFGKTYANCYLRGIWAQDSTSAYGQIYISTER